MFIGRPFLLNYVESPPEASSPEDNREEKSPTDRIRKQKLDRQGLVDCCIRSAREVLDICRTLRDNEPGLARGSYIEYSSCRAAMLVLIAYSIQNQSNQFRQDLRDGLDMIREMSTSGDSARSEVRLIEMLERALVRLRRFNTQRQRHTETTPSDQTVSASGYEILKHWEAVLKGNSSTYDSDTCNSSSSCHLPAPHCSAEVRQDGQYAAYCEPQHGPIMGMLNHSRHGVALTVPADRDAGPNPFYSTTELALFGGRDMAALNTTIQPETQVLDQFLAMSDSGFYPNLGIAVGIGPTSVDTETPLGQETTKA